MNSGFPALTPEQRAALRGETRVSVAINALIPTAIIWLLGATPPQILVGPHDLLSVIVPGAGVATLVMTLILTKVVRKRVAAGQFPSLNWPRSQRGLLRLIPQGLLLRALVNGLLAILLLVPITFAAVALAHILPLTRSAAALFEVAYGALVGLVMTRFIVLPAMADPKDH